MQAIVFKAGERGDTVVELQRSRGGGRKPAANFPWRCVEASLGPDNKFGSAMAIASLFVDDISVGE